MNPFAFTGKTYGLQPAKKSALAKKPALSIFSLEDDDIVKKPNIESGDTIRKRKIDIEQQQVLEADPTAFSYDEVLDEIHVEKSKVAESKQLQKMERKAKYIEGLLKQADQRNREQGILNDRVTIKVSFNVR
jgi:coiled-coil domain-containing protein 55